MPLKKVIQTLLDDWGIVEPPTSYVLQFDNSEPTYVLESNRYEIKDGTILNLVYSPGKQIEMAVSKLKSENLDPNEQKATYAKLARSCRERYFANEFVKKGGLNFLVDSIKESSQETTNEPVIRYCLDSLIELVEHCLIDWSLIESSLVRNIIHLINTGLSRYSKPILLNALVLLENIFMMCPNHNQLIESSITLPNLISHIQSSGDELDSSMHQNCLALINAIFSRSDLLNRKSIAATICSKQYRTIILNNLIKDCKAGSEKSHQLYLLQTNLLSLHEERLCFTNEQDVNEKIEKVCRIAFENDLNYQKELNSKYRVRPNDSQLSFTADDYAKIGFVNYQSPHEDFRKQPGILSLDLIIYFAQNHTDNFVKIVLENCSRSDKEHECPFIRSGIEITRFLVQLLKIKEPANDEGTKFFEFFFTHDYPLEELFCICVPLLNKTWKEMRATLQDFDKVISVFKQQLIEAFKSEEDLVNFDVLKKRLSNLSYNEIINIWQKEKINKKEWENNTQSISELKQIIRPELIGLIKQQRIQYLTEGTKFVKYTAKGNRLKDKFWFCRLSNKSKIFFYGDCDEENIPSIEHLPKKLPVLDIKCVLTGKDCPHMKDNRSKKSTFQLAFSLIPESETNEVLNFVAPDEKTFDYWIDGLNALLNLEMNGKETEHDLDLLLSLEMKLKLLETEGFSIPETAPDLPDPPTNYNFDL